MTTTPLSMKQGEFLCLNREEVLYMGDKMQVLIDLIIQKAKARADLQKELKELQKDAQIETDVKVNLSDVKKARKEVEQANREQQEGTRENIKLRAQELAHLRMQTKEAKEANKAEVEALKQKRLLMEENSKLAVAESKRRLAEAKVAAAEQKAAKISKSDTIQGKIKTGDYDTQLSNIRAAFQKLGLSSDEVENKIREVKVALDNLKGSDLTNLVQNEKLFADALKTAQNDAKILRNNLEAIYNPAKQAKLSNDILNWLTKNTAASKEARQTLQQYYDQLQGGKVNVATLDKIQAELKQIDAQQRGLGKLGKNLKDQFKQAAESFTQWMSVSSAVMLGIQKTREAVAELKELDNILTEISKTSDLTTSQLKKLGDTAFDTASKYGKKASDYLTGVQEMYRAGFDNAEQMAELSVLAQSAGDMDATAANNYLMATNAAYKYKGSVEELNKVLDGQNYITNNAAISMKDISDATSETASVAAQYGVQINELSALIATATANTRESGSEVGTALKAILINLQDTTSKPVTETFDALGISMTKVVDGAERLKTPIELIYELADAYNSLPEGDVMRANILNEIGQKRHANTLASILSDMESYEKMLDLYSSSSADGSAFREAEKSANNLQGSLNKLGNTWTDTVENIANSDTLKGVVNTLNFILTGVNKLTDALGSLGSIGLGAGLFMGLKNVGRPKMFGLKLLF